MKRFFLLFAAAAALILSGCHKEITDAFNDENNTKVDFTYSVSGMTVSFTPQCDMKVTGFEWFFGDEGSTKIPYPSHTFKTAGTHKVHLIGTWYTDGKRRTKDCMHEVTVKSSGDGGQGGGGSDPAHNYSKAYIKGFRFNKVAWDKGFYRCKLIFTTPLGSNSMQTAIKYLKQSETPYDLIFNNPYEFAEFPDPYDVFTDIEFQLLYSTMDNEASLHTVLTGNFPLSDMNENVTAYTVESSTGNTSITTLIEYK